MVRGTNYDRHSLPKIVRGDRFQRGTLICLTGLSVCVGGVCTCICVCVCVCVCACEDTVV